MGFVESEARHALLATRRRSIGQREIEQAMQMLLSGEVLTDAPQPHPAYDQSPFGGSARAMKTAGGACWMDEFDPSVLWQRRNASTS